MNKSNRPADPPAAEKCENCERLKDVLHRDRSGLADGIDRIRKLVKGWWWVPLGEWACYDYTERTAETMRTEFSNCLRQIEDVALSTMKASGNLAHAECCGRRPPVPEPAESEGKEIDRWAIGQALNDLHFQKDSVRKCAAVNDLLERAERHQFRRSARAESELDAREAVLADIAKKYAGAKEAIFFATAGAIDGWDAAIKWMKGRNNESL